GDPLVIDSRCRLYTLPLSTHSSEARAPRAPAIASRSCEAGQSTLGKTSRGKAGSRRAILFRSRSTLFGGRYGQSSPARSVRAGSFVKTITAEPATFLSPSPRSTFCPTFVGRQMAVDGMSSGRLPQG